MGRPEQPIAADAPFGDLAIVLREIRNGTELTLEALADRIGYTPSALSKAAAGISLPGERLLSLAFNLPDSAWFPGSSS